MSQSRKGKKRGPFGSAGNLSAYDNDIVLQCSPVKCSHSTVMKKLRDQLKLKKSSDELESHQVFSILNLLLHKAYFSDWLKHKRTTMYHKSRTFLCNKGRTKE